MIMRSLLKIMRLMLCVGFVACSFVVHVVCMQGCTCRDSLGIDYEVLMHLKLSVENMTKPSCMGDLVVGQFVIIATHQVKYRVVL